MRAPHSRGRQRMVPLCSAGRTAFRGCEPPQRCQPQHDRPLRGSNKSARAATIFIHNGAPQALIGCFEADRRDMASSPSPLSRSRLHSGRSGSDPETVGRGAGEDESLRGGHAGDCIGSVSSQEYGCLTPPTRRCTTFVRVGEAAGNDPSSQRPASAFLPVAAQSDLLRAWPPERWRIRAGKPPKV